MTMSMDINAQELDGIRPTDIQISYYKNGQLTSADAYASMLLDIADNALVESQIYTMYTKKAGAEILHKLRHFVQGWVDPSLNRGPFVLVHGDLEPHNLIVNDEMEIISVLGWEWSRIVPRQFFLPPLWLDNPNVTHLCAELFYNFYLNRFDHFLDVVRELEREKYGNNLLADEWREAKLDSGFLVANALENWSTIHWFMFRYFKWEMD